MAGRGTRRFGPPAPAKTFDDATDRAIAELTTRVAHLLKSPFAQAVPLEVELVEGLNKIGHGMGRSVSHFAHAALPTADVTLTSAQAGNPTPHVQLWVQMAGATRIKALLFMFPQVG